RNQLAQELQEIHRQWNERQGEASGDDRLLGELEARHARLTDEGRRIQADLDALAAAASAAEAQLTAARQEVFEAVRRADAARSREQAAAGELRAVTEHRSRLREDLDQAAAAEEQARAEADRAARDADETRRRLEAARRRLAEAGEAVDRARREARIAEDRVRELQERLADARGRVRTLAELQRAYEGFFAGVRAVLRGRDAGEPDFTGIIGVVAELIQTDRPYEAALEAALGGAVQHVVTRTADDAQRAVEGLRRRRAGRATFLPLDALRATPRRAGDARLVSLPGVIGWAVDLVRFDPGLHTVAEYLLGRVLVAEDLGAARRAARDSGFSLRVVTRDGDVVHPGGPISGGSRQQQRGGLISRRRDLAEAEEAAARLEAEYGRAQAAWERARQRLEESEAHRTAAEAEAGRLNTGVKSLERELAAARDRLEAAARRRRALATEVESLEQRAGALERGVEDARALAEAEARRAEVARARVEELEQSVPQALREAADVRERLVEVTAAAQAAAEQLQTLRAMAERARREREQLAARLQAAERELAAVTGQMDECDRELAAAASDGQRLAGERERSQAEVDALRQARRQAAGALDAAEQEVENARRRLEEQGARTHRAELEEARVRDQWDRLRATLNLEAVEASPEDEASEPADLDVAAAARDARRLRAELETLGPVNPGAEQEYLSVRERHRFLRGQMDDLSGTRERLESLVADIDRHMERMFRATFGQLRERFQHIFRRLFGGGRADLVLTTPEPGDGGGGEAAGEEGGPPSAGVDIVAQPPGKRMQPLSLLSGGERALTAIALMFAMLEVKAPPFCILDEIDAALDDNNLRRYVDYLMELSRRIQFIVITHQKATMAAADTLYGVTLGEGGASRLVAVRLAAVAEAAGQ
ncbi:MAG TPA: chromosome segregation protein SMC, partial [Bacillota bacterium]